MEKIELKVLSNGGMPLPQGMGAVFGIAGGTIGRGGQNKLILSDDDGTVARVHAMVRLDHGGAYIANLSESKTIWVEDRMVQSGEEVALALHASIRIGSYVLRAEACSSMRISTSPGGQQTKVSTLPNLQNFIDERCVADKSLPVRDITEKSSSSELKHNSESKKIAEASSVSSDEVWSGLLSVGKYNNHVESPDLFAKNISVHDGRESSISIPMQSSDNFSKNLAAEKFDKLFESIENTLRNKDDEILSNQVNNITPGKNDVFAPGLMLEEDLSFAKIFVAQQPSSSLIPDDFNPFAVKNNEAESGGDAWSAAGLSLGATNFESLSPDSDQLVRNIPLQGNLVQGLDNASHPGLPRKYATATTLDPLVLFGEGACGEADNLSIAGGLHRGSELSQAFNLPCSKVSNIEGNILPSLDSIVAPIAQQCFTGSMPKPLQHVFPEAAPDSYSTIAEIPEKSQIDELSAQSPPDTADVSFDVLAEAFAKGARLDSSAAQFHVTPEFMFTFGEVLRVAIQGTIDLLAARSEIKREFRAGMTIIASGANNPLKFLPSAEGVIMQMTNKAFPGFMSPVPAMKEAFMDLRIHQLALMAGIAAAYSEALMNFDPVELERKGGEGGGLIDKLFNVRKAALWDGYKSSFEMLRRHAEDDLMAFSGQSFLNAYEQAELAAKNGQESAQ